MDLQTLLGDPSTHSSPDFAQNLYDSLNEEIDQEEATLGESDEALSVLTRREFRQWAVRSLGAANELERMLPDTWLKDAQPGES